MEGIKEAVQATFGTSALLSSQPQSATSSNPQLQQADIQTLVDSYKYLQMQNSVALGSSMGKLNISLSALPEAEPSKLTSTPTGQSSSKAQLSKDVGKDRLLKAAEGPCQDQEFNELLTVLRVSLHNNYIIYKRALAKNINFIRVLIVKVDNFLEKRIVANDETFTLLGRNLMETFSPTEIKRVISLLKDKETVPKAWRSVLAEWLVEREEKRARDEVEREERKRKYIEEIEMYIQRSEELKARGMSRIIKDE
ncbi:hypothetical protein AgCh_012378 [Apium graveolens]